MFMLNGKPLALDVAFTSGDINYPANWMRHASISEKNAIGITEVAAPAWYDQRFYWGVGRPKTLADTNNYASYDKDGKGEGDVTSVTPGLKTQWIDQQKAAAGSKLAKSDWMIIRKEEASTAVPGATTTYRTAVRTKCKEREDQITACDTTDKLATLISASETIPGTASNGAAEVFDNTKEVKDSDDNSYDPKRYESFDPKQYSSIQNPDGLKIWPTE